MVRRQRKVSNYFIMTLWLLIHIRVNHIMVYEIGDIFEYDLYYMTISITIYFRIIGPFVV